MYAYCLQIHSDYQTSVPSAFLAQSTGTLFVPEKGQLIGADGPIGSTPQRTPMLFLCDICFIDASVLRVLTLPVNQSSQPQEVTRSVILSTHGGRVEVRICICGVVSADTNVNIARECDNSHQGALSSRSKCHDNDWLPFRVRYFYNDCDFVCI